MAIYTALLFAFVLGLAKAQRPQYPVLPYVVAQNLSDGVQERTYESLILPSYTSVPCLTWNAAQSEGYFHLAMYTRYAHNAENKTLSMGVPVLLNVKHIDDPETRCAQLYTTSFYVGSGDLPEPTNPNVKLSPLAITNVYAASTSNLVRNPSDLALALRVKLNVQGLSYCRDLYYIAIYNSPSSLRNTNTEVLIPASC